MICWYQQENIIHEILHALLDNAGLPEENLDKTIQILTPRIHAFLIDNIEFQKKFLEFEKNEDIKLKNKASYFKTLNDNDNYKVHNLLTTETFWDEL